MFRQKIIAIIEDAIRSARSAGGLALGEEETARLAISVELPHLSEHGDFSSPVALQIAPRTAAPDSAMQVADIIANQIERRPDISKYFSGLSCHPPGFINFKLGPRLAGEILSDIVRLGADYGKNAAGAGQFPASGKNMTSSIDLNHVQEVYLKCSALLRQATEPRIDILNLAVAEPIMSPGQWFEFLQECKTEDEIYSQLDLFLDREEGPASRNYRVQARLILKLAVFPEEVEALQKDYRQPDRLARYCVELVSDLTEFWSHFNLGLGLYNEQLSVVKARLALILAARQVLGNALGIIGLPVLEQI